AFHRNDRLARIVAGERDEERGGLRTPLLDVGDRAPEVRDRLGSGRLGTAQRPEPRRLLGEGDARPVGERADALRPFLRAPIPVGNRVVEPALQLESRREVASSALERRRERLRALGAELRDRELELVPRGPYRVIRP